MRPTRRALTALLCLTALGWGLAACGGSTDDTSSGTAPVELGDTGSGSSGSGSDAGSGTADLGDEVDTETDSALPDDACTLLGDTAVEALLGLAATPTEGVSSLTEGTPQFVSCYWGDFTTDTGVVSVAVSVPTDGIDYLATLTDAVGGTTTPVDVGEDGELLDAFVMPGGGGAGSSVVFHQDGMTVVVARSGEAVDTAALEAAAAEVSSRL